MPAKETERASDPAVVDRWIGGLGWIPHPHETMERASHALVTGDGVWLVDPLDADGVDDLLAPLDPVVGIVVLSNHHVRDAAAFADRFDVPVTLPTPMTGVAGDLTPPIERLDVGEHCGGYELLEVARVGPVWQEYALYDGETLVASESIGAATYLRVGDERLGVMPLVRPTPPRAAFANLSPERILSGHGPGVHDQAAAALDDALTNARRRFPRAIAANGRIQLRNVIAAVRS